MLMTVRELVIGTLQQWQNVDVMDVELAITLLYMLIEAIPVSSTCSARST